MEQREQVCSHRSALLSLHGDFSSWATSHKGSNDVWKDSRFSDGNRTSTGVPVGARLCVRVCVCGAYRKGLDIFAEQVIHHILRQQRLQLVDVTL